MTTTASTILLATLLATLLGGSEDTLLRDVTGLYKAVLLLGGSALLLGYNTSVLVHVKVYFVKSSSRLVGGSVPDLSA